MDEAQGKSLATSEAGKLGGAARAKSLSKSERSEIARQAALSRWGASDPKATHTGTLKIGETEIPCAVLADGTRIITQYGFMRAIGRTGRPAAGKGASFDKLPPFLSARQLKSFVSNDLGSSISPIAFQMTHGGRAYGYRAELLPQVCEVYLKARDAGALDKRQMEFAKACDIIMRGLANVGIIALVDEVTGYQVVRARDELAKILEAFVAKEIQKWIRTFVVEFYELICKLRKESMDRVKKRPRYFGRITNDLVYRRLAPGVLQELEHINPADERGHRRAKHFQHLTPDLGHPRLKEHLAGVTTAMKFALLQGLTWGKFRELLNQTHPKWKPMPLFDRAAPPRPAPRKSLPPAPDPV